MKKILVIPGLLLAILLFACAGSNSAKKPPEPSDAGIKEITRGITRYNKGCYKDSLAYFFRAHELFTASDQLSGVAMSLNNIGNVYRTTGDLESAVLFFDESLAIYHSYGDKKGVIQVLSNKAAALIDSGMLEEAAESLRLAENISEKEKIVFAPLLNIRGILLIKKKEYAQAEDTLQKAVATVQPNNLSELANVNFAMGNLMLETKQYEKAVNFFKAALEADRLAEFSKGIADDLAAIGSAYLLQGKNEPAVNYLKRSIKIYALNRNHKKVSKIMRQLETVSKNTDLNISVTKHFVKRWLEGKTYENPCK
jgi:tetratricopeptide (TPR) repeat protein